MFNRFRQMLRICAGTLSMHPFRPCTQLARAVCRIPLNLHCFQASQMGMIPLQSHNNNRPRRTMSGFQMLSWIPILRDYTESRFTSWTKP